MEISMQDAENVEPLDFVAKQRKLSSPPSFEEDEDFYVKESKDEDYVQEDDEEYVQEPGDDEDYVQDTKDEEYVELHMRSKFRGVYWEKRDSKWRARVNGPDGKRHSKGSYQCEIDAAYATNQLCRELGIPVKNPGLPPRMQSKGAYDLRIAGLKRMDSTHKLLANRNPDNVNDVESEMVTTRPSQRGTQKKRTKQCKKPRKRKKRCPPPSPLAPKPRKLTREERKTQQYWRLFLEDEERKSKDVRKSIALDVDERWAEHDAVLEEIPYAKHFTPTLEEFSDFRAYCETIRDELGKYGIVKVTVPEGFEFEKREPFEGKGVFPYSVQDITMKDTHSRFANSPAMMISASPKKKTSQREWEKKCANRMKDLQAKIEGEADSVTDPAYMEKLYWRWAGRAGSKTMYGNDIIDTKFKCGDPNNCTCHGWGLNCLPKRTMLQHVDMNIPGVNSPMMYVASLWSTFTWHIEDSALQSINYEHCGSSRTWYGVPAYAKEKFDDAVSKLLFPEKIEVTAQVFVRKCTMFSPVMLHSLRVPVYKLTQNPRDFIVTAAGAYHSGFSHGFSICEAVNFALPDWLSWGLKLEKLSFYRDMNRIPVVSLAEVSISVARSLVRQKKKGYPKLIEALTYVLKDEMRLRQKLDEGANFIQHEKTQMSAGYCKLCSAALYPSYVSHTGVEDEEARYCLRHKAKELQEADQGHWEVRVGFTGKDLRQWIKALK